MTMIKKVIYRQKHALFVISGAPFRPEAHRVRSAPPPDIDILNHALSEVIIEPPKEKALKLETQDGKVITQEMLDNFVDSSEEEEPVVVKKSVPKEIVKEASKEEPVVVKEEVKQVKQVKEVKEEIVKEEVKEVKEEVKKEEIVKEVKKPQIYSFGIPEPAKEEVREVKETKSSAVYQVPSIITPKTVYKKGDHGMTRRKLIANRVKRIYNVQEILQFKERKSIPLIYERSIFKKAEPSEAEKLEGVVYDSLSLYRRELNRVAKSTLDKVLREIKNLTVKTEEEMTEMANLIFEKAIREVTYQDLYIQMLKSLKTTFVCQKEEEERRKGHSIFWATICKRCKDTFMNKENWSHEFSLKENSVLSFEERIKFEEQLEEKEGERIKKKGIILGTIRLLANFFIHGMISDNFILTITNNLKGKIDNQENVEILCVLFENCGEKLMKKNSEVFNEAISAMKANMTSYDQRVKFILLDLLESKIPSWKAAPVRTSLGQNRFAGLRMMEEDPPKKEEKVSFEIILKQVREAISSKEADLNLLRQSTLKKIKPEDHSEFLGDFFYNVAENFDDVDEMINFFLQFTNAFKKEEITSSLKETFFLLEDLKYDAPFAYSNFYKLILYLQSEMIITKEEMALITKENFEKERKKIIRKWLGDFGYCLRLERVADISELTDFLKELVSEEGEDRFRKYLEKYGA